MILDKGIGVQSPIMHNTAIKQPWCAEKDMASIRGYHITPNFIPLPFSN